MLLNAILHATLPVKIVISILFLFSIITWTLIIYNFAMFRRMEESDLNFIDNFLSEPAKFMNTRWFADEFQSSPVAKTFSEITAYISKKGLNLNFTSYLSKLIQREIKNTIGEISKFQFLYATMASSAPFIGLFGTVWGIMNSFSQIAKTGRAGLEIVAPGIAEALFTTAIGLFAAIPAVIAYNFFQNKIKKISTRLEYFATEFENYIARSAAETQTEIQKKMH